MTESARGDIVIVITADSSDVDRQFENVERRLRGLNDQVERQTRLYQSQNRTLAAARRQQQGLLDIQMRHLRNLSTLNRRQDTFNQRTRASVRDLDSYRRSLLSVADATDRVNNSTRQVRTAEIADAPVATQSRRRARETIEVGISTDSIDRAVESVDSLNDGLERTRNLRTIEAPRVANSQELERSTRALQSYVESLDGVRRAQTGVRTIRTPSVGSSQEIDRTNRSLRSYVMNIDDIRRAQTDIRTIRTPSVGSPQELDRTNRALQSYSSSLDGVRRAQTGLATIRTPSVGVPQGIERSNRALQSYTSTLDNARMAQTGFNTIESPSVSGREEVDRTNKSLRSYIGNLDDIRRAQTGIRTIRAPSVGSPQEIERTNRSLQSYVRSLDNVSRAHGRLATIRTPSIGNPQNIFRIFLIERSNRALQSYARSLGNVQDSSRGGADNQNRFNNALGVGLFRLSSFSRSAALFGTELSVVIIVLVAITLALQAMSVVVDLVGIGLIGLAGIVTFVYTNAMQRAARSTSITVQELQVAQQALLGLGFLFEESAMILERAVSALDDARIDPSDEVNAHLSAVGVNLGSVENRGRSTLDVIQQILEATRGLSDPARFERLEAIFGDGDVANALVAAGDTFLDRIQRASGEIRVLNRVEIQAVNNLGGSVLSIFGTLYSDVRAFFVDNIDAAQTIVRIAEQQLRPLLQGLLDYFEGRIQEFTRDPESFIDGIARIADIVIEVLQVIHRQLQRFADAFTAVSRFFGLSATGIATLLIQLVALSASAQLLRPLSAILARLVLSFGSLIPIFLRLGPIVRTLIGLAPGAAIAVASSVGVGATTAVVTATVSSVIAALGITYLLRQAQQRRLDIQEGTTGGPFLSDRERVAEDTQGARTIDGFTRSIDRINASTDAWAETYTNALDRNAKAQAELEVVQRANESRRLAAEKSLAEAIQSSLQFHDQYTASLLSESEAFIRATSAVEPLGDQVRRLGLTFESVNALAQRVLLPTSVADALAAQEEIRNLEGELGKSFRTIVAFFSETSRFIADQTENAFRSLGEFQEVQARPADTFRSTDEALRVLRQIDQLRIPQGTVEGQIHQAELFLSIQQRYGLSLDELISSSREYLRVNSNITRESENLRDITLEWTGVALSAIDTLSGALGDIVFRVRTVGEAFRQVFETVIRQAIQALVNTLLNDLIRRINEIRQQAEASSGASALANAVNLAQSGIGAANAFSGAAGAAGAASASQGPVFRQGQAGASKATAPSYGDVFQVSVYALGTASPADVERSVREGIVRGYREANDDPYTRAATQRTAEGRN